MHFNLVENPIKLLCDCGASLYHIGFRHIREIRNPRSVTCLAPLSCSRFHPITLKYTTIRTPAARLTATKCYLNPNNDAVDTLPLDPLDPLPHQLSCHLCAPTFNSRIYIYTRKIEERWKLKIVIDKRMLLANEIFFNRSKNRITLK